MTAEKRNKAVNNVKHNLLDVVMNIFMKGAVKKIYCQGHMLSQTPMNR